MIRKLEIVELAQDLMMDAQEGRYVKRMPPLTSESVRLSVQTMSHPEVASIPQTSIALLISQHVLLEFVNLALRILVAKIQH